MTISLETIQRGVKRVPARALIYGPNGAGKSHLATQFPSPIFLDLENNINHFDVPKQRIKNWKEATTFLDLLMRQEHDFKTLVIDSLDQLEIFAKERACETCGLDNINEGYGKGLLELFRLFVKLRDLLDSISEAKKMHIILIAHAKVQQIQMLGEISHHKIVPSLNERVAPLFTDWCNIVGYASQLLQIEEQRDKGFQKVETIASFKEDTRLGNRILHVESSPQYVAKNVFKFPTINGKIKLCAQEILSYIKAFYVAVTPTLSNSQQLNQQQNQQKG